MKLSKAIDGYFLDRSLELAPTTIENYRHYMGMFADYIGDRDIKSITKRDIVEFLHHMRNTVSAHTVFDIRSRLATLWTWAASEFEIENIVAKVPKPKYKEPEVMPYSRDEIEGILEAIETNAAWTTRKGNKAVNRRSTALRDRAMLLTLLDSGMRASELCALTIADYDESRGRLHIKHGKGDKGRFSVIGKRAQRGIWRYLSSRPEARSTEPLFSTGTGTHIDRKGLYHLIDRAGNRAGVKDAGVHRFRHTFAVQFLRNGGNIFQLKEIMGHNDIRTLQVYVRIAESDIDSAQAHSPADNWKF